MRILSMSDSSASPENLSSHELAARQSQIRDVLNSQRLMGFQSMGGRTFLKGSWIGRLKDSLDTSIQRARRNGQATATVLQFSDASLNYGPDKEFADAFFEEFGAVAKIGGREIPVTSKTLAKIAKDTEIPKVDIEQVLNGPVGSAVTTKNGHFHALVVETKIDGVKIALDGSSVHTPDRLRSHTLRPYLLVKT